MAEEVKPGTAFDPDEMKVGDDDLESLDQIEERTGLIEHSDDEEDRRDRDVYGAQFKDDEEEDEEAHGEEESGETEEKEAAGEEGKEGEAESETEEEGDEEDEELREEEEPAVTIEEKELLKQVLTKKVDGVEERITVEELLRRAQKAEAADARFREAAQREKDVEGIYDRIKEDGIGVWMYLLQQEVGEDAAYARVFKACRDVVAKQFEYDQLSEDQKRQARLEQELEREKMKGRQLEEERKAKEKEQRDIELANLCMRAAQKVGLPPRDGDTLMGIAKIYDEQAARGNKITMLAAAREYKDRLRRSIGSHLTKEELLALPGIQELLSENAAKERIEKVSNSTRRKKPSTNSAKAKKQPRKRPWFDTYDDARKDYLESKRSS